MSEGRLPIQNQYERDRMMSLVDEISDELYDNPAWLKALGVEATYDDGWFELRKGGRGFLVEAGPGFTVLVNGKAERPKHLFFDGVYFRSIKARIVRWACECESDNDA